MALKSPLVIPAWQRIIGVIVALGLMYFLYRVVPGDLPVL
jgi:hypothetical protein